MPSAQEQPTAVELTPYQLHAAAAVQSSNGALPQPAALTPHPAQLLTSLHMDPGSLQLCGGTVHLSQAETTPTRYFPETLSYCTSCK
jgi:hypothetical protein